MMCKRPARIETKNKTFTAQGAGIAAVPCGQCLNCRINQERIWVSRILLEQIDHGDSCFVSLTYDDKHLPNPPDLQKKELQDYIKRLRYHIEPIKIRYFGVGEYGKSKNRERVWNPHYHVILFGLGLINHRVIRECWKGSEDETYGVTIGELNKDTARYTVGYISKKIDKVKGIHPESYGRKSEFMISSRKEGGIGLPTIKKIAEKLNKNKYYKSRVINTIKRGNKNQPLGRYLSSKLMDLTNVEEVERKIKFWANQENFFNGINAKEQPNAKRGRRLKL